MRLKNMGRKPKAANNEGRTTKVTSIMISQELKDRLSEYKDAYEGFYNESVTYDQMLRHWMENVKRFDPKITPYREKMLKIRNEQQRKMADRLGISVEQLKWNRSVFDPTAPENKPWELQYMFEKDGEEYPARAVRGGTFMTIINGGLKDYPELIYEGYSLINEVGIEIRPDHVRKLSNLLVRKDEERRRAEARKAAAEAKQEVKPTEEPLKPEKPYLLRKEKQNKTKSETHPNIRKVVFWDIDTDTLDWTLNKDFIINRVKERGNAEEINSINEYYGNY